jgi:hypothetical protein
MPDETTLEKFHRIMDFLIDAAELDNHGTQEEMDDVNDMRREVAEVLSKRNAQ